MTEKINFTMAKLAEITAPATGRRWVYDTKESGLGLLCTDKGSKSFYLYRKIRGRPERIRIGAFPETTVDTAREQATKLKAAINSGENPADAKRKARGELTLGQLFDLYLEFHAVPRKKAGSVATDKAVWKRYMTGWNGRKLSTITHSDIQSLHAKIGKNNGKYAANRLLALISTVFTTAITHREWKFVNPCAGVKMFAEKSRDRFLQPDELPRFINALDAHENQLVADAFRLMLLTGARKGNLLAMRWADLDLDNSTWRIPDTKTNEPQRVHLPAQAVEILAKLETERKDSPFVFPARTAGSKSGHLTDVTKPWASICDAAGLPDLRMHDLRRSLGSWMAASGASLQMIGKQLGHHDQATTTIYSRLNIDPVRESVDQAVTAMMAIAKPKQEGGDQ